MKNALDDIIERGGAPPPTTVLKLGSLAIPVPLHNLPQSFLDALQLLHSHPHALRLAYLFQCFLDLFGGFVHEHDHEELGLLSRLSGIPAAEIVPAMEEIDAFFAPAGGSMLRRQKGGLLLLKMVPAYVRGGGAYLRMRVFKFDDYSRRFPDTGWLLAKWHNALYNSLKPVLGA